MTDLDDLDLTECHPHVAKCRYCLLSVGVDNRATFEIAVGTLDGGANCRHSDGHDLERIVTESD